MKPNVYHIFVGNLSYIISERKISPDIQPS